MTHLSVDVNGIGCRPIDFQLGFAILGDLPNERDRRSAFAPVSSHVVHFEESFTVSFMLYYVIYYYAVLSFII